MKFTVVISNVLVLISTC